MNVIKLTLIITGVFGLLAFAAVPAMAQYDKEWDGGDTDDLWDSDLNWDPDGEPGPTDTVLIGNGNDNFFPEISSADATCKTLDIKAGSRLTIKGKSLTLGDSSADTTSHLETAGFKAIPGTILMLDDGAGAPGVLILYRWVTFVGGGTIEAWDTIGNGVVKRAGGPNDKGIVIGNETEGTVRFVGTINVMCDFEHEFVGFVGTETVDQTMTFGPIYDDINYREPYIKGGGIITAEAGTVIFSVVDFDAANAPDWRIGVGTIQLTDDGGSGHYTGESFSITKGGLLGAGTGTLDLDHSLATTGTLAVGVNFPGQGTLIIKVASGTVFSVEP